MIEDPLTLASCATLDCPPSKIFSPDPVMPPGPLTAPKNTPVLPMLTRSSAPALLVIGL